MPCNAPSAAQPTISTPLWCLGEVRSVFQQANSCRAAGGGGVLAKEEGISQVGARA